MRPGPASLDEALDQEWDRWVARGLERRPRAYWARHGAEVATERGPAIDFSSNDYLGLATDPRLVLTARQTISTEGVGATASRLIAGTHVEHERLEQDLAGFFGSEACVAFGSGYGANTGAIPALVGPRDAVFADALNHASLIDGIRLSRAEAHTYRHGDVAELRRLLSEHRKSARRAIVVTDGLFSMDGDLAPMQAVFELAREFGAWTYLDDAHAVGALGARGRGTLESLGIDEKADITVGTLGKAFGVAGAFVYGSRSLCRHLLNHARSFVFSTAMPPAQAAVARESLRIVQREPARRQRLHDNASRVRAGIAGAGIRTLGESTTHVVPVPIGPTTAVVRIGEELRSRGILVGAVRPPTVAEGSSRLRISVSAAHTDDHIDRLIENLAEIVERE
jgi:8-amino-7-oxononanoate synthase